MPDQKSLAEAVLQLFDGLAELLKNAGLPDGAVRAYLFGGCAVHMYASSRVSIDVDAEFDYNEIHRNEVLLARASVYPVDYDHPVFGRTMLELDPRFNTTLGPLHVDYQDRALLLDRCSLHPTPLSVWLPSPIDLAISKLGRMSEGDIDDILLLLGQPGVFLADFERLAMEASQYYVGPNLAGTVAYVKRRYREGESHDVATGEDE